jgi:alkylation response protein AidB-like acyl-CoA dehydrogenase
MPLVVGRDVDSEGVEIGEGTSEIQRILVAGELGLS